MQLRFNRLTLTFGFLFLFVLFAEVSRGGDVHCQENETCQNVLPDEPRTFGPSAAPARSSRINTPPRPRNNSSAPMPPPAAPPVDMARAKADCEKSGRQWKVDSDGKGTCEGGNSADPASTASVDPSAETVGATCSSDWTEAAAVCEPGRLADMSGSDSQMIESTAGQVAMIGGTLATQPNANEPYGLAKSYNAASTMYGTAGAANLSRGAGCITLANSCKTSCKADLDDVTNRITAGTNAGFSATQIEAFEKKRNKVRSYSAQCNRFASLGKQMTESGIALATQAAQTLAAARSMEAMNTALPSAVNTSGFQPVALVNPTDPCLDAVAAKTNPICVCRTNPTGAACLGISGESTTAGGATAVGDTTGGRGNKYGTNGSNALVDIAGGAEPYMGGNGGGGKGASNNEIKQEGGGGPQGGSSGGGGGGGSSGGSYAFMPPDDPGILGGVNRSSGGFSGYGKPEIEKSHDPSYAYMKLLGQRFKLSGLLPNKAAYVNRLPAQTMSLVRDGVTGPNDISNWEKVSRQYQRQSPTMEP